MRVLRVQYDGYHPLVSVREPGEWYNIADFVQPDNPDVRALYRQLGPSEWECFDFVCQNISYRRDIEEWWSFPSETLARRQADCEDTSNLLASILNCFSETYVGLGTYNGGAHAWVISSGGQIYETTFTKAATVKPDNYLLFALFNHHQFCEFWPGALEQVLQLRRLDKLKISA